MGIHDRDEMKKEILRVLKEAKEEGKDGLTMEEIKERIKERQRRRKLN